MTFGPLLIRADAGPAIGIGHVMRCLALAQSWQDLGGEAVFLCAQIPARLTDRLAAGGIRLVRLDASPGSAADANQAARAAEDAGASWLVIDGYQFGVEYQRAVAGGSWRRLLVDDFGCTGACICEAVLDQNITADGCQYPGRPGGARTLFGPRYALLRREFRKQRAATQPAPTGPARTLLVTCGGGLSAGIVHQIVAALVDLPLDRMIVTVGLTGGVSSVDAPAGASFTVSVESDPDRMPELMDQADLAVAISGSTVWELACCGVPALLLSANDSQTMIAVRLQQEGTALLLGSLDAVDHHSFVQTVARLVEDASLRHTMSRCGRTLVDGRGALRVWEELVTGGAE